ncbi:hypothetical protein DVH24_015470, partial [Malus domestica]
IAFESSVTLTSSTTRAAKFYKVVVARSVVPECQVVWDDLPIGDAIIFNDLIDRYKLCKVNSPPPTFNLSVVQEFYANVPSKFPDFGSQVYVRGMHSFDLITCHYDNDAYHHQAYLDSFILLVKNEASKLSLKPFYRLGSDFLRRNVLGTLINGNPTLEAVRVLYAMMSLTDVPFGFFIFRSIMSKTKRPSKQQRGSTIYACLIALIC